MKVSVNDIVRYFETLTPQSLERLGAFYTEDAGFKDPFNQVQGLGAIEQVYRHMFDTLDAPRFVIRQSVSDGQQCFLSWEFKFRFRRWHRDVEQTVRGASHLLLGIDGRIRIHRDYWDAAEELYEKLPLLGGPVRWLRRRAAA